MVKTAQIIYKERLLVMGFIYYNEMLGKSAMTKKNNMNKGISHLPHLAGFSQSLHVGSYQRVVLPTQNVLSKNYHSDIGAPYLQKSYTSTHIRYGMPIVT